ncbi:MAG: hypothetical protein AAFR81_30230 [Chloroflexota bacterium]
MNSVDERIQRWGEKVAGSKGTRKSFYVQLDWFEDAEHIRTIAELKEASMFTQFMRISLRTLAPLLLFGDTDGILSTAENGDGAVDVETSTAEMRLLKEMRSLAEAVSYGLAPSTVANNQIGELTGSTRNAVADEVRGLEERLMAHMASLLESNTHHTLPGVKPKMDGGAEFNFDGLGDEEIDTSFDDDEFDLSSLMVEGGDVPEGDSVTKRMLKSALGLFDED